MDQRHTDDPLQQAIDRGTDALYFVNSRLVMDYIRAKFWRTLPALTSRNAVHSGVSKNFYEYLRSRDGTKQDARRSAPPRQTDASRSRSNGEGRMDEIRVMASNFLRVSDPDWHDEFWAQDFFCIVVAAVR